MRYVIALVLLSLTFAAFAALGTSGASLVGLGYQLALTEPIRPGIVQTEPKVINEGVSYDVEYVSVRDK